VVWGSGTAWGVGRLRMGCEVDFLRGLVVVWWVERVWDDWVRVEMW